MNRRLCLGIVIVAVLLSGFPGAQAENRRPQTEAEPPFGELTAQQQKAVDDVLRFWEQRSKSVKRYRCQFQRWEYDPVFGPAQECKTWSKGVIMYFVPDRALFRVDEKWDYRAPTRPGEKAKHVKREVEPTEHWICEGTYIWEFDHRAKRLIQRELPPHMRGKAIIGPPTCLFRYTCFVLLNDPKPHEATVDGPLQFLFGIDAERIKERYWIRRKPVPEDALEYHLEMYPKSSPEMVNCQKMDVIIVEEDFLPKGLVIYHRNFDPHTNPARTTFLIEHRETNWNVSSNRLNNRQVVEPSVPAGWKKVVERFQASPSS